MYDGDDDWIHYFCILKLKILPRLGCCLDLRTMMFHPNWVKNNYISLIYKWGWRKYILFVNLLNFIYNIILFQYIRYLHRLCIEFDKCGTYRFLDPYYSISESNAIRLSREQLLCHDTYVEHCIWWWCWFMDASV